MKIKNVTLETVCGLTSKLPENTLPEIAFAGKSNVGKSSLLNVLVNRRSLARTSSEPGKTQTINFYHVNEELYLVDLPGYGYAKVSQEIRAKWGKLIERYLHGSKQLRAVFLLIDIRHAPSENDRQMYEWITYNGYDPIIIATKLDKIKRSQVPKQLKLLREGLGARPGTQILPFSAQSRQGAEEIWAVIEEILKPAEALADDQAETAAAETTAALEDSAANLSEASEADKTVAAEKLADVEKNG